MSLIRDLNRTPEECIVKTPATSVRPAIPSDSISSDVDAELTLSGSRIGGQEVETQETPPQFT
jgi:hypothetical protein